MLTKTTRREYTTTAKTVTGGPDGRVNFFLEGKFFLVHAIFFEFNVKKIKCNCQGKVLLSKDKLELPLKSKAIPLKGKLCLP